MLVHWREFICVTCSFNYCIQRSAYRVHCGCRLRVDMRCSDAANIESHAHLRRLASGEYAVACPQVNQAKVLAAANVRKQQTTKMCSLMAQNICVTYEYV